MSQLLVHSKVRFYFLISQLGRINQLTGNAMFLQLRNQTLQDSVMLNVIKKVMRKVKFSLFALSLNVKLIVG